MNDEHITTIFVGFDEDRLIDKRRPYNPHEATAGNGHVVGMELSKNTKHCTMIVYLYDSIENCIDMIIAEGYYRFERTAPKGWQRLTKSIARRIRANIEADVAYA